MKLTHTEYVPDDLYEAARVTRIMRDENEGRWRLRKFTVTPEDYRMKQLRIVFGDDANKPDRVKMEMTRVVPPGDYITLARRMIDSEIRDLVHDNFKFYPETAPEWFNLDKILPESKRFIPVMSDTPAEIMEHAPALNGASGRVLITGLGLGCLPHALLTRDDVTRIDIIEIDPDVIALTGKYLTDPRVHIWRGSAADTSVLPADLRWDYAWHDIWTHIAARNLDPATAEHRIAYCTLRELWGPRVDGRQDCWAEDQAIEMQRIHEQEREEEMALRKLLRELPVDEAVDVIYERILRDQVIGLPGDEDVTDEMKRVLDPEGALRQHLYDKLSHPDFWNEWDERKKDELDPMGMPNEHLEVGT